MRFEALRDAPRPGRGPRRQRNGWRPGAHRVRARQRSEASRSSCSSWRRAAPGRLTSPLVRAVQTAEIVALATKLSDRAGNGRSAARALAGRWGRQVAGRLPCRNREQARHARGPRARPLGARGLAMSKGTPRSFDKAMVVGIHVGPGRRPRPAPLRPRSEGASSSSPTFALPCEPLPRPSPRDGKKRPPPCQPQRVGGIRRAPCGPCQTTRMGAPPLVASA